jgi:GPN-loop GTPase
MPKYAQLVIGPAGSGKSTYVDTIRRHCEAVKRVVHCVNLDPAAEHFSYPVSIDIRDLISLEDVAEELEYGPNGGLVFCLEYLCQNMNWLQEQLGDYEDDYLIIDCPGQVELYTHLPIMQSITKQFNIWNYKMCSVYLIDSLMIHDTTRFFSGVLMCLSAMIQLELPHINVLTKCDLIAKDSKSNSKDLESFFDPKVDELMLDINHKTSGKYRLLNQAIGELISDYSMVSFVPLDITDEESIGLCLMHVDQSIQWGEEQEPTDPDLRNENNEPLPDT